MNTLHRHLAAIWFVDIVGYTSMSEANEGEAVRLARAFQRAARGVVDRFGGRVVKSLGDGALAEFPSTEMAVRSAHAMLGAFASAAAEEGLETRGLRIGVHVGDVAATEDGDVYGDGVNVASRLQSAAEPGEVWVSEDVWRQLRRRPELAFESRGQHELKGLGQPIAAYAVVVQDEEGWTPPDRDTTAEVGTAASLFSGRTTMAAIVVAALVLGALGLWIVVRDRGRSFTPPEAVAESAAPGVAIVPFTVNDPELERWREGMIDLLSANLDGAGDLRAIDSRTVLARWRELVPADDGVADLPTALEVARRSGARYGVVGSAVSSGASIRLSAEVYELETGRELGAPQVEGSPDSIFGMVDRLSIEVLALLLEQGETPPRVDLASVTTSSLTALKAYLEGEGFARRANFGDAIPAYELAVETDSTFALAHYRLGDAIGWTEGLGPEVRERYATAKRFVGRLPRREADLLDVSLGYANGADEATRLAREASRRYPDDPSAWFLLGETYFHLPYQSLASNEDKRDAFRRAVQLDPTFLPAEIHLVDIAFQTADDATADSLIQHFAPASAEGTYGQAYPTAYALAFGDSIRRSRALARLDSLPYAVLQRMNPLLVHPRFHDLRAQVLDVLRRRPEYRDGASGLDNMYGLHLLTTGQLDRLADEIETGVIAPPAAGVTVAYGWFGGLPLPAGLVDAFLPASARAGPPNPVTAAALFRALETGERAAALNAARRLGEQAETLLEAGDSASARGVGALAEAIAARDAMLRGQTERALESFETVYRDSGFPPAALWAAELLEDQGEDERAIRYLEQIGAGPITGSALGRLYESTGRREDAIEAYGWVVLAWEGADPVLQPRVAEARQAIARLQGLQRG